MFIFFSTFFLNFGKGYKGQKKGLNVYDIDSIYCVCEAICLS
jgi:hypothetical protein